MDLGMVLQNFLKWESSWVESSSCGLGLSFMLVVGLISSALAWLSFLICDRFRSNMDKKVSFECGFDPLSNPRMPFSLPYFLVALLFLVFDVEVVLLLCVCYSLKVSFITISALSGFLGVLFCVVLFLGLVHEINEGSLDWR